MALFATPLPLRGLAARPTDELLRLGAAADLSPAREFDGDADARRDGAVATRDELCPWLRLGAAAEEERLGAAADERLALELLERLALLDELRCCDDTELERFALELLERFTLLDELRCCDDTELERFALLDELRC